MKMKKIKNRKNKNKTYSLFKAYKSNGYEVNIVNPEKYNHQCILPITSSKHIFNKLINNIKKISKLKSLYLLITISNKQSFIYKVSIALRNFF